MKGNDMINMTIFDGNIEISFFKNKDKKYEIEILNFDVGVTNKTIIDPKKGSKKGWCFDERKKKQKSYKDYPIK